MANPPAGSLASYVKWGVTHGRTVVQIVTGAVDRFGQRAAAKLNDLISKYAKETGYQPSIATPRQLTEKQRVALLRSGFTQGINRVTLNVTYRTPGGSASRPDPGELVQSTWYVDLPSNIHPDYLRQAAMEQLYARFNEAYGGNAATLAEVARFIEDVEML